MSGLFRELRLLTEAVVTGVDTVSQGASVYARRPGRTLPRVAKQIEPLCWVSALDRDLPGGCTVCLERLEAGHRIWRLPCMHAFHEVCMIRFLQPRNARSACPICRCDIKRACEASNMKLECAVSGDVGDVAGLRGRL